MPIKMKFPDGTEVEGEVEQIVQLLNELKELMDVQLPTSTPKKDLDKMK